MPRSAASPASAGRPRKSPLRLAAGGKPSFLPRGDGRLLPGQLRTMMISEFEQWLRSRTNQEKRPFQEETVVAYAKAARALDAWMTEKKIDGDFTACDAALLNSFFRDYNAAHTRGAETPSSAKGPSLDSSSQRAPDRLATRPVAAGSTRRRPGSANGPAGGQVVSFSLY
jgi:hypothetical protein